MRINRSLVIPDDELEFKFTTSSGPGGQHANKAATRVEVAWNVARSAVLGPRQRGRVRNALSSRIDSSGTLRVASERFRSQTRNRQDALERLARLVAEALKPRKARVPTSPSAASKDRRLEAKSRRAGVKASRRKPEMD